MKKEIIEETKRNGIYKKVESVEKDFDDGFVHEADFHQVNMNNYGKYHKGPAKTVTVSTNDPRITKPFLQIVCGIFLMIGLIFLLSGMISLSILRMLMGIFFIVFISIVYFNAKKPIDKIEKELKESNAYYESSAKEVRQDFMNSLFDGWDDAKKSTFTKSNYNKFVKMSLPIYIIITIIVFSFISFVVNILIGLMILAILILSGVIYFWIISKICKW